MNRFSLYSSLIVASFAAPAFAGPMVFQPQNSAIFADASLTGNSALLASTVRPKDPRSLVNTNPLTPERIVQQAVLGQISAKINDKIFSSNPGDVGSFNIGGGSTITYTNVGGQLEITFFNPGSGTTVISLSN